MYLYGHLIDGAFLPLFYVPLISLKQISCWVIEESFEGLFFFDLIDDMQNTVQFTYVFFWLL